MALLVLLLIVAPLVELYVIIQVANVIGGWETVALLLIEGIIGAWLLRHQSLSTLEKINAALSEHRVPGKELLDGLLIIVAGALMLAPGFISDFIGYLFLIPLTRAPVRGLLTRRFRKGKGGRFVATFGETTRFVGVFRAGRDETLDTTGRPAGGTTQPRRTELEQ